MTHLVKILKAEFIRSCAGPEQFPTGSLPEIAVVGRSNVGKSSLIRALGGGWESPSPATAAPLLARN